MGYRVGVARFKCLGKLMSREEEIHSRIGPK